MNRAILLTIFGYMYCPGSTSDASLSDTGAASSLTSTDMHAPSAPAPTAQDAPSSLALTAQDAPSAPAPTMICTGLGLGGSGRLIMTSEISDQAAALVAARIAVQNLTTVCDEARARVIALEAQAAVAADEARARETILTAERDQARSLIMEHSTMLAKVTVNLASILSDLQGYMAYRMQLANGQTSMQTDLPFMPSYPSSAPYPSSQPAPVSAPHTATPAPAVSTPAPASAPHTVTPAQQQSLQPSVARPPIPALPIQQSLYMAQSVDPSFNPVPSNFGGTVMSDR